MAELKAMPAIQGWGGWKNQFGNITAPMQWQGVSVRALMELVGGGTTASSSHPTATSSRSRP